MTRWVLAFIAASLVGIIALAFVFPGPMLAPGALIPAHASLAGNCFACHVPLQGAAEARCTTCHAVKDIGLFTVAGAPAAPSTEMPPFHQGLASTDCMGCHTDHPMASLTPPHSHTFAHDLLSPSAGAACSDCHLAPVDTVHADNTLQCSSCHIQTRWAGAMIDHTRFFALTGPHDVACSTCHTRANDFSQFTCFSCHEHQESDLIRKHQEEGIRNIDNCVACHRDAHAEGGEGGERNEGGEGGEGGDD